MIGKWIDKFIWWLAYRLPARLVYYAAIRVITYASVNQLANKEMGAITGFEATECWRQDKAII